MTSVASQGVSTAITEIEARLRKATGAPDAQTAMRRLCSTVIKASKQKEPPYKIKPLLDVLGVSFEYEDTNSGAAEASVSLRKDKLVLEVPKVNFRGRSGMYRRWRFSIAHEFAHIVLLRTLGARIVELTYQDEASYRYVEDLCDYTASHLLLPRTRLTEVLRNEGFSQGTIRRIADRFDTSEMAVLRATNDLLPGGAIFTIRNHRRHSREKCEPRVFFCSSYYSNEGNRPWLPRGCTMKHIKLSGNGDFENVSISLGEKRWALEGRSMPWIFGPRQKDMFHASEPKVGEILGGVDIGTAIVCAAKGKFDRALFQSQEA